MSVPNSKMKILTIITVLILTLLAIDVSTAQDKTDYSPKFSGYVRAWYQADFSTDMGQYLVKQARLGVAGSVNEYAGYKMLVDFTRLGKLTTTTTTLDSVKVVTNVSASFSDILLDAAAVLTPLDNLEITGGQFKVPFGTDNLRSDQNADFANRPLLTTISPAMRDLGLTVCYKIRSGINADFTAGSFNGSGFNKPENDKYIDYVLRAVISPVKDLNFAGNYYSGKSNGLDLMYYNVGADFKTGYLFLDAEYSSKNTENTSSTISGTSYFAFVTYDLNLQGSFLKDIIPGFRYEAFDPNTSKDNDHIDRMTFGLTFEFAKITFAHFRINYEKYSNNNNTPNPDKLILELQTKF